MLAPGTLIAGKYRIERLLGEGGMGAVYVAVNERLRKRVALKVLGAHIAEVPGAAERFTQEAIAASSAKHPGVVEIFDADVHEGLPWIAMELLEGEGLSAVIERGPIPLSDALWLTSEALSALVMVHAAGIIHRDLKPDNLFIERLADGTQRVKVLDFGIAKVTLPGAGRLTQTGTAMGTPDFLAPEQASDAGHVDQRADVYAMGAILFHALTGQLPYEAQSFGDLVRKMYTQGPRKLAQLAPGLPAEVIRLVDACVSVDPAARPASAAALKEAVDALRGQVATQPAPAGAISTDAPAQPTPATSGGAPTAHADVVAPAQPTPATSGGAPTAGSGGVGTAMTGPPAEGWAGAVGTALPVTPARDAPRPPTRSMMPFVVGAVVLLALAGLFTGGYFVVRALTATPDTPEERPVMITVHSGITGELYLDGERQPDALAVGQDRTLELDPGPHILEVRSGDRVIHSEQFVAGPGGPTRIDLVTEDTPDAGPADAGVGDLDSVPASSAFAAGVRRTIQRDMARIRRCYDRSLRSHPTAEGVVTLRITVEPTGRVSDASVADDTLPDPSVAECVVTRIARLRFSPVPEQQVRFRFPLSFRRQARADPNSAGADDSQTDSSRGATGLAAARACGVDQACVIRALQGRARSEPELRLLTRAYYATGNFPAAATSGRRYLQRYPNGPAAPMIRAVLNR